MAITTTVPRRPASFYVPVTAAFGALAGLFVGTAQGSGPLGIVVGALLIGAIAFGLTHAPLPEKPLRWGLVALFALAGYLAGAHWAFYLGLGAGAAHMMWQVRTLDADSPARCLRLFRSNRDYGYLVFAGIVAASMAANWG